MILILQVAQGAAISHISWSVIPFAFVSCKTKWTHRWCSDKTRGKRYGTDRFAIDCNGEVKMLITGVWRAKRILRELVQDFEGWGEDKGRKYGGVHYVCEVTAVQEA